MMGNRALRIYSTDRNGSNRVSIFAEETSYQERYRFEVGTEICTVYKDGRPICYIHNWNHCEVLEDWEPPKPDEASTIAVPDPLPDWANL